MEEEKQSQSIRKELSNTKPHGLSLIEIILAIAALTVFIAGISGIFIYEQRLSLSSNGKIKASYLAEEALEAVRNIRDNDYANLTNGDFQVSTSSGSWGLVSGTETIEDDFVRQIAISDQGNNMKKIVANVNWEINRFNKGLVSLTTFLGNWLNATLQSWFDDLYSNFVAGRLNSVAVDTSLGDGEVSLERGGAWMFPRVYDSIDITGGTDANDLFVTDDYVFAVTDQNSSGGEFWIYDISNISSSSPGAALDDFEIGTHVYAVHVVGDFAYLATAKRDQELVILDVSDPENIVQAGSYNADANETRAGYAIYAASSTVYLGTYYNSGNGDHEFYVLDVSSTTNVVLEGSAEISAYVYDIEVKDGYAYLATSHNTWELYVVDLENIAADPQQAIYNSDETRNAYAVAINGNELYLGTQNNSGTGNHEFYVLDISDIENGNITADPNDEVEISGHVLAIDADDDYAYVGTSRRGSNEIYVIDLDDKSDFSRINLSGSNYVRGVQKKGRFLYAASEYNSGEIQITEGGAQTDQNIYTENLDNSWQESRRYTYYTRQSTDMAKTGTYSYRSNFYRDTGYVYFYKSNFNTAGFDSLNFSVNTLSPFAFALYGDDSNGAGDYGTDVEVSNSVYPDYLYNTTYVTDLPIIDLATLKTDPNVVVIEKNSHYNMPVSVLSDNPGKVIYVRFRNSDARQSRALTLNFSADKSGAFNNSVVTNGYIYLRYYDDATLSSISNDFPVLAAKSFVRFRQNADMTVNGLVFSETSEVRTSDLSGSNRITINGAVLAENINYRLELANVNYNYDYHANPPLYFTPSYSGGDIRIGTNLGTYVNLKDYAPVGIDGDIGTWQDVSIPLSDLDAGTTTIARFEFRPPDASAENMIGWYLDDIHLSALPDTSDYADEGIFTSRAFDTENDSAVISRLSWTNNTDEIIKFRLRTAPDSSGSPGSWSDWLGPSGENDYYTDSEGEQTINSEHSDGSFDRWVQYRAFLLSGGTNTPVLEDVTVGYE